MINACSVSAPGKLFLFGEYAVLDGAPAILSAVDRRVRVTVAPASNGHWSINAPDIGIDWLQLAAHGQVPNHVAPHMRQRLNVYEAVLTQVQQQIGLPDSPLAIDVDSSPFVDNGHKLGLGSSAAVTSALTAALAHAAGQPLDRNTLRQNAIAAHRQAQNGRGSGADVATAIHGGVIEFQADAVTRELTLPAGITGMAVVTGDGAATPDLVKRVRAYGQSNARGYAADMAVLTALANNAHQAMADGSAFLRLVQDYFEALQTLGKHARACIVLPRHHELARLAAEYGGVFKTSGAGGGDLGLVFAPSGPPVRRLSAALVSANAKIVPLRFGAPGLKIG